MKNAIAVYRWFVRHAIEHRLSAEELGILAKQLASTKDPAEAVLLRERLLRGFYGI